MQIRELCLNFAIFREKQNHYFIRIGIYNSARAETKKRPAVAKALAGKKENIMEPIKEVVLERTYDASSQTLWQAWTNPEMIKQ